MPTYVKRLSRYRRQRRFVPSVVAAGGASTGSAAITLGAVTLSSASTLAIAGTASVTLGAVTLSSNGAIANTGTLSATLGAVTLSAAGQLALSATLSQTLGTLAVSAAGTGPGRSGTLATTLGAVTTSAKGYILTHANVGGLLTVGSNGRYFSNTAGPLVLSGMHTWYTPQDGGSTDPPSAFDWAAFLASLVSYGHNVTKSWRMESAQDWGDAPGQYFTPHPYLRTGPGSAGDGHPKFDLDSWNHDYFERVIERVIEAGNAGIYVVVQLFQGWHLSDKGVGAGDPWLYHPFKSSNNINSVNGDPNSDGDGYEMRDVAQTTLYNRQKDYVAQMVNLLNHLDNVIWEISNEDETSSTVTTWQRGIAAYIKTLEAGLTKQHAIGMTVTWPAGSNSSLFASTDASWISIVDDSTIDVADGSKVVLWDTDHVFGLTSTHDWIPKSFAQGHNPLYMDEWDGAVYGADRRADATYILIRRLMGDILGYSRRMDLANTTPQSSLASTGYCLAKTTGIKHLWAFQSGTGAFTVALTGISGTFTLEWFRVSTGEVQAGSNVSGGATRTLTPPWSGEVAAFLEETSVTATLASTLGTLALSSAGALAIAGTATPTLGAVTLSSAGTLALNGTAAITLGAATLSAAGQVALAGTLAGTLGALTLSSAATLALNGAASITLGALTLSASNIPSADSPSGFLFLFAADSSASSGSAAITLGAATLSAAGQLALSGQAAITLGAVSLSAAGTLVSGASGAVDRALGAATLTSQGQLALSGTLDSALAAATLSAAGQVAIAGQAAITLGAVTLDATGALSAGPSGTVAATLGAATLAAQGQLSIAAQASITLSAATLSSLGAVAIVGAATITLADATMLSTQSPLVIEVITGFVYGPTNIGITTGS